MILDKDSIVFTPKPTINNFIDHTGDVFGRLTVIGYAGQNRKPAWYCQCECGNITIAAPSNLRAGIIRSCGCLKTELWLEVRTKHGEAVIGQMTPEYRLYFNAKNRCNNKGNKSYKNYGGRGIEFRFDNFDEFLEEVGRRPSKAYSLDRIDNDGHYEKGNVRWATVLQQAGNRRDNINLTLKGRTQCVRRWATEVGMNPLTVYARLKRGWCDECAVFMPLKAMCTHL